LQTNDERPIDVNERMLFTECFAKLLGAEEMCDYTHWVANVQDRLVAVMSVKVVPQLPMRQRLQGSWGYLTNCYVLPEYRNRGIGRELLEHVKNWSESRGCSLLIVWPSARSYSFYRRFGFEKGTDPLVFSLNLDT
jgi:ribosomal protein S18 acetylase RimI-like enzyme